MTESLLPPSATGFERALEGAMARYEDGREVPLRDLWRAADCPANLLPWLAWAYAVRRWSPEWDALVRRQVVRDAMPLHRIEGTRAAVERMLADLGLVADVVENPGGARFTARLTIHNSASIGVTVPEVIAYLEEVGRLSVEWAVSLQAGWGLSGYVGAGVGAVQVAAPFSMTVDVP